MSKVAVVRQNKKTNKFELVHDGEIISTRTSQYALTSKWRNIKKVKDLGITNVITEDLLQETKSDDSKELLESIEVVEEPKFSINQRFSFYKNFLGMVVSGVNASIVITGKGGLGKSHTMLEVMKEYGYQENEDYTVIKGYSTAKAMYRTLYENKNGIVVFDDCDSVLQDKIAVNILKTALDSYDKRIITWGSEGFIQDDSLPNMFEFTGQVVFISNLPRTKIDQAILSRSLNVDLSMTKAEAIERMAEILPHVLPEYSSEIKEDGLKFLDENQKVCKDLNMRTLLQVCKVRAELSSDWENNALYLISN